MLPRELQAGLQQRTLCATATAARDGAGPGEQGHTVVQGQASGGDRGAVLLDQKADRALGARASTRSVSACASTVVHSIAR